MTYKDSKESRAELGHMNKDREYAYVQKQCNADARRRFKEKPYALKYMEQMKALQQGE